MELNRKKLKALLKNNKYAAAALILMLGLVLMLIGRGEKAAVKTDGAVTDGDVEYIRELEARISDMVSEIKGAGHGYATVSIASSSESVYVKENKKSSDSGDGKSKSEFEDSVLTMTDSSGNEYAVVTKRIMPRISGVTVVCDGGDDPYVKASVTQAVCTLLSIGSNKVCVIAKAN